MLNTQCSEKEWNSVAAAPLMAGLGVIKADFGVVSSVKEFKALVQWLATAKTRYSDALVHAICDELTAKGDLGAESQPDGLDPMEQIKGAVAIVERTYPAHSVEFGKFLYDIAEVTAKAAGEGFFGTGPEVSSAETAFLTQLKHALRS